MKHKKVTIIMLLLVILGVVWTINIRHFTNIRQRLSASQSSTYYEEFLFDSLEVSSYEFKPLRRDPFNVYIDTSPREPVMPQFFLRGVVMTGRGALALMELSDGQAFTMKQGQEYMGVKMYEITPREVTVSFRGRKHTFKVSR